MGLFNRKAVSVHKEATASSSRPAHQIVRIQDLRSKTPSLVIDRRWKTSPVMSSIPQIEIPEAPDPEIDPVGYLRSIQAVRPRCHKVLEKAKQNQLLHFDVDLTKFADVADYLTSIIKRDYGHDYASIPPHGRWQHFEAGGRPRITLLLQSWPSSVDSTERTRRLIDLFLVSVLLDAGAGNDWAYKSKETGKIFVRSEGLGIASLEMFKAGLFSSDPEQPHQVDATALQKLTPEILAKGMQVSASNPMSGLEGRAQLLIRLGSALLDNRTIFGQTARPGNMIDYLIAHPKTVIAAVPVILLPVLWEVLMDGLSIVWPASRTKLDGRPLGDAWPSAVMPDGKWQHIVPFHKLTQWLCYSIMVPMTRLLNVHFAGAELQTGLPEYRNGGLLVDTGLLTLKESDKQRGLKIYHQTMPASAVEVVPMFNPDDDVIVEWRACTVGFLDELLEAVNLRLGLVSSQKLNLAQMLEAGTWKGGRELAAVARPVTKGPPIGIISDGTIF